MDATLELLADRTAIADLVSRLGRVLDEGAFDEMHDLLADDVRVRTPGGEVVGREAAVAQAARNHRPEQPIQHLFSDLVVDAGGGGDRDRAEARANLVAHFGTADTDNVAGTDNGAGSPLAGPVQFSMGAVYGLGLVRTGGRWRFERIHAEPVWSWGTRPVV
jgi:hypothetical protein